MPNNPGVVSSVCTKWSKGTGGPSGSEHFNLVTSAVPYDLFQITAPVNRQNRKPGDPCHTLARDNAAHAAVAIGFNPDQSAKTRSMGEREEQAPTLRAAAEVAVAVAMRESGHGYWTEDTVAGTLRVEGEDRPSRPSNVIAHTLRGDGFDASEDGTGRGTPIVPAAVAFTRCDDGRDATEDKTPTMRCGSNYSAHLAVATTMAVRRLTPVECERLQGFPDGYTAIPWRSKPAAECPDGPRYRALGNSMAVPCMRWIGQRIAQVDSITGDTA